MERGSFASPRGPLIKLSTRVLYSLAVARATIVNTILNAGF